MLAKQHQFKIMKQAGKDIQNLYKKHRLQNKDDYYSYEALAVQCEASRMTLEAIYDDIFAAQHSLLAKLKHVESGGNMTNYSIPSPSSSSNQQNAAIATNQSNQTTQPQEDGQQFATSQDDDLEDITSSLKMLKTPMAPLAESTNSSFIPSFRTGQSSTPQSTSTTSTVTTATSAPIKLSSSNESNNSTVKSVRERRREIEQKRLARPTPQSASGGTYSTGTMGGMESPNNYARTRLREIESARMVSPSLAGATTSKGGPDRVAAHGGRDGDDNEDGELKERRGARKVVSPA